jgi:hypothetical protein
VVLCVIADNANSSLSQKGGDVRTIALVCGLQYNENPLSIGFPDNYCFVFSVLGCYHQLALVPIMVYNTGLVVAALWVQSITNQPVFW